MGVVLFALLILDRICISNIRRGEIHYRHLPRREGVELEVVLFLRIYLHCDLRHRRQVSGCTTYQSSPVKLVEFLPHLNLGLVTSHQPDRNASRFKSSFLI